MNTVISTDSVAQTEVLKDDLKKLLSEAMEIDNADMGNVQIYDEASESLHMIVQKGFDDDFLESFAIIKPFSPPSCGRSIGLGIPITIEDVLRDASLRTVLNLLKFRSVRSIPIFDKDRVKLGVISTHSKAPDHTWVMDNSYPQIKEVASTLKKIKEASQQQSRKPW